MQGPLTMAGSDNAGSHAFDRWRFDAGTGDLSDGTTSLRLEPQVARLLDYFLTHQGTLISRDELMAEVWDNRVVSDDAVNRCISILRQKLSPHDKNAYIETVVRRGFVSHFPPPLDDTTPAAKRPRHGRRWLGAVLSGTAALLLVAALYMRGDPPPEGGAERGSVPMVAVLPFVTSGLEDDDMFFANGMHDDLLTQLAQLQSMRVISRTSVSEYRDSDRNITEIGRELGADAILEGGLQRVGNQIRINVQLIDAHTDVHLWAQNYDRELSPASIFDVQAEIARAIASAMHSTLTPDDAAQLEVLPTDNMAAYRAYHEAMDMRDAFTIAEPAYVAALKRAVALDPEFVRAWAELAGSLSYVNFMQRDPDSIQELETMLERIRALAPQSSEHLVAQSYYTYYVLGDNDRASELIGRALLLRPSDPQILELQSWIRRRQGDIDGMIESVRKARILDPRNPYWTTRLAFKLALAHRYDEAIDECSNAAVDSFELSALHSALRVREHREPGRLLDDLQKLQWEYGVEADPFDLWEAHIAARDFEGAAAVLARVQMTERPADAWTAFDLPPIDVAIAITERFLEGRPLTGPTLAEARAKLANAVQPGVLDFEPNSYLATAYVTATAGDSAETERLVRAWFREATHDLAQLVTLQHHGCRALGIAGAVPAAVECLRSAFEEPSQAMPFIEPLLPYYDSIRDDPRFFAEALPVTSVRGRQLEQAPLAFPPFILENP